MGVYLSTLFGCLPRSTTTVQHTHAYRELKAPLPPHLEQFNEKSPFYATTTTSTPPTDTQLADEFAGLLLFSRTPQLFRNDLSASFPPPPKSSADFSTTSWTESLALAILNAITAAIEAGVPLGAAKEVVETARRDVEGWIGEHPVMAGVMVMIVALGVLVVVAPWVVEGLGFGGLGVRLGEFFPFCFV